MRKYVVQMSSLPTPRLDCQSAYSRLRFGDPGRDLVHCYGLGKPGYSLGVKGGDVHRRM